jgi:hypothetical protein
MKIQRKCVGTTRHGENAGNPCRLPPLVGQTRCYKHGGNAQQALKAARMRMLAAAEPAIMVLLKVVGDDHANDSDRISAAKAILDRGGLAAGVDISAVIEHRMPGWENVLGRMFQAQQPAAIEPGPSIIEAELAPSLSDLTEAYERAGISDPDLRRGHASRVLERDVETADELSSEDIRELIYDLRPHRTIEAEVIDVHRYEATPGPGSRRLTDEELVTSHSEDGYPRLPSERGRRSNTARLYR